MRQFSFILSSKMLNIREMAKLKIYTFPDRVLAQKANPIERVDKSYYRLADDMLETMYDAPGIGLAANQVGILEQFLVVDTDYEMEEPGEGEQIILDEDAEEVGIITNRKPLILINPIITYKEGHASILEGCLSVPEYRAEVDRSEKIRVEYRDIDGKTKTLATEGLQAICIQHEMDHLAGRLFIDRLSPLKREMAKKKLIKLRKERE
jgi:peptide deformylase